MAISDVCPPPLYIGEILILERREIQTQMREIQIATGEEEVTYGHFRRLPPTSTSLYRSDSLTSSLSDRVLSKTPRLLWLSKTSRRPAEHQMLPQPMLRCQIRKFFIKFTLYHHHQTVCAFPHDQKWISPSRLFCYERSGGGGAGVGWGVYLHTMLNFHS